MSQFDWKAALQKSLTDLVTALTSRTFWGIVIISYLYIQKTIDKEQYQQLAMIITGGTQLPKLVNMIDIVMNKNTPPKPPVQ